MRINRLYLKEFRNLIDFEVDFDQGSSRQVIVGRNGVGKSNLLEAIIQIFRDLDLEEATTFSYQIEYICRDHAVRITNEEIKQEGLKKKYKRTYEVSSLETTSFSNEQAYKRIDELDFYRRNQRVDNEANPKRLLPNYVFGYYSGDIARFQGMFAKHEERYYQEQSRGEEAPLRALFLTRPQHSQFALLSFFAVEDNKARDFLRREMRIEGLDAVLFALREPYWHKGKKHNSNHNADSRFWGAGGKVSPFLDSLFDNSFAPMAFSERMRISVGQTQTKERRFCYLPNLKAVQGVAAGLSNKEFFARLESLVFSNLTSQDGSDVRIWLNLDGVKKPASFSDLAEGERQLLTVLGLLRFTAEDEALFILDEPDTHLNPAWCIDYLEHLETYGASLATSQIIMTTHSPLTFAGLEKKEVVILERNLNDKICAQHPVNSPKGMGFQAILTSDFFGLRSTLDKETLGELDEKRELALKKEKTDDDWKRLTELDEKLGKLDFSKAARDPLYLEFIKAMMQAQEEHPELAEAAPSKADWNIRKDIAKNIAIELKRAAQS